MSNVGFGNMLRSFLQSASSTSADSDTKENNKDLLQNVLCTLYTTRNDLLKNAIKELLVQMLNQCCFVAGTNGACVVNVDSGTLWDLIQGMTYDGRKLTELWPDQKIFQTACENFMKNTGVFIQKVVPWHLANTVKQVGLTRSDIINQKFAAELEKMGIIPPAPLSSLGRSSAPAVTAAVNGSGDKLGRGSFLNGVRSFFHGATKAPEETGKVIIAAYGTNCGNEANKKVLSFLVCNMLAYRYNPIDRLMYEVRQKLVSINVKLPGQPPSYDQLLPLAFEEIIAKLGLAGRLTKEDICAFAKDAAIGGSQWSSLLSFILPEDIKYLVAMLGSLDELPDCLRFVEPTRR